MPRRGNLGQDPLCHCKEGQSPTAAILNETPPVIASDRRERGNLVVRIQKKRNLTQSKLAETVLVDDKHISCIEAGKNFPSPDLIGRFSSALGVEPKDLFEFEYLDDTVNLKSAIISMLEKLSEVELTLAYKYIRTFLIK